MISPRRSVRRTLSRTASQLSYETLEPRQLLSVNLPQFDIEVALGDGPTLAFLEQDGAGAAPIAQQSEGSTTTSLWQQTQHGLAVFGSYVTVTQGETQNPEVVGQGLPGLQFDDAPSQPIGSRLAAESLASAILDWVPSNTQSSLVWFAESSQASLVWQVEFYQQVDANPDSQMADQVVLVDAASQAVLIQETPATLQQLVYHPETKIGEYSRIVINDAVGPSGSQDYADPFDSVVALPGCTGTLIAANVVLSARHCGSSAGDSIRFGDNSNAPIYTATVASVSVPAGAGSLLDGGDLNILTLTEDVPENIATPMRLTDLTTELVGMTAATVGYGFNGVGSSGHGFSSDGLRWGGENVIDAYGVPASAFGTNIISTDFDDGSTGANTIPSGSETPLPFEATTAPGDSGGPILVRLGGEWVIAGVLSGGTTSTSVYGDISWWTGVEPFRTEIEAAGGQFYFDGTVAFNQDTYSIGETVTIIVEDEFATEDVVVEVASAAGDIETLTLTANGSQFVGSIVISGEPVVGEDGTLQVNDNDLLTVNYGTGATDQATVVEAGIQGTDGDDVIVVDLTDGISIELNGQDVGDLTESSITFNARAGYDQLTIIGNPGDESVMIRQGRVELSGLYSFLGLNAESVTVESGGGQDEARLYGTNQSESFTFANGQTLLEGDGFEFRTAAYADVRAFGGGGEDHAEFEDTAGNDRFTATSVFANLRFAQGQVNVRDFESVNVRSIHGGFDASNLVGTAADETLFASPTTASIQLGALDTRVSGFDRVVTRGNGGHDSASLLGSPAADVYNSRPTRSYLFGDGFFNQADDFAVVRALGEGGDDRALMFDSPSDDTLYATPTVTTLYNDDFRSRAVDFGLVTAIGSTGFDNATFVDSAGNERFTGRATDAFMIGDDFFYHAIAFNRVTAQSTEGQDRATLISAAADHHFFGSRAESYLQGSDFFNSAEGFSIVSAHFATPPLNPGVFQDSELDDTFIAREDKAVLFSDDYLVEAIGLGRANAISNTGGLDRAFTDLADFDVIEIGGWV